MIIQRQAESELRPDQVRTMAHALYHLANVDGVSESELEIIRSFLKDGGLDLDPEALSKIPFSLEGLLHSLDTMFLRKTFLRICVLLAKADGTVSAEELAELRRLSQALGIDEPFDHLVEDLEGKSL
jgi:uncharacterized tellurite resistance protein B-like protein